MGMGSKKTVGSVCGAPPGPPLVKKKEKEEEEKKKGPHRCGVADADYGLWATPRRVPRVASSTPLLFPSSGHQESGGGRTLMSCAIIISSVDCGPHCTPRKMHLASLALDLRRTYRHIFLYLYISHMLCI